MSTMSCDILTIQASTVASESVFSLNAMKRTHHISQVETRASEFEEYMSALNIVDQDYISFGHASICNFFEFM
ncbi:hypothetical protein KSP40_PGU004649 [Platanthera guangdongensis]|uniref:HAT C-terminal dimerisation domain-containing protein n=1 Tax=Platanthera guangdongensis TaxID=2320717 RepID=A0ABR2LCT6_9ASPA